MASGGGESVGGGWVGAVGAGWWRVDGARWGGPVGSSRRAVAVVAGGYDKNRIANCAQASELRARGTAYRAQCAQFDHLRAEWPLEAGPRRLLPSPTGLTCPAGHICPTCHICPTGYMCLIHPSSLTGPAGPTRPRSTGPCPACPDPLCPTLGAVPDAARPRLVLTRDSSGLTALPSAGPPKAGVTCAIPGTPTVAGRAPA